jgi:adenosylcobyric acid synthase
MQAPAIMVQGTASSVGKSLIATALCRFFKREGLRVAPFKAQNMALNSAVTPDGLEIGRAQAVQAEAAGVIACADMNPILLKPEGDSRSQVVVLGRPIGSLSARDYQEHKPSLQGVIAESLARLRARHDLVVIEGAGSPAEINLKARDIVNMHVAKVADAPVLLVGDIDRGGVFAAFVGTLELLEPDERERIAAFVINKFRGDVRLLEPGLEFLRARTGKPVLGVVPYVPRLRIADEDSVSLDDRARRARPSREQLDIAVLRLPRIANYDDFEALEHEPGVVVRFVEHPSDARDVDLLIVPGSKSTVSDLAWLRGNGLADVIALRAQQAQPLLGICGGCQMLGESLADPEGVESSEALVPGLALLPLRTRFERTKITAQVQARAASASFLAEPGSAAVVSGYEIHMGRVTATGAGRDAFELLARNGQRLHALDGAVSENGMVVGTMLHGLFENAELRAGMLQRLRARRGLSAPAHAAPIADRFAEYDRLEAVLRAHVDCALLRRLARCPQP